MQKSKIFIPSFTENPKHQNNFPPLHTGLYKTILLGDKNAFQCLEPECEKIFRFKSDIERHITIHSDKRPFFCSYPGCSKAFKRADNLKTHEYSHKNKFSLMCFVAGCDAKFRKKTDLQRHLLEHQSSEIFTCDHMNCQQTFISATSLRKHQREECCQMKIESPKVQVAQVFTPSDVFESAVLDYDSDDGKLSSSDEGSESPRPEKLLHSEKEANYQPKDTSFYQGILDGFERENQQLFQKVLGVLMQQNQELKEKLDDVLFQIEKEDNI